MRDAEGSEIGSVLGNVGQHETWSAESEAQPVQMSLDECHSRTSLVSGEREGKRELQRREKRV